MQDMTDRSKHRPARAFSHRIARTAPLSAMLLSALILSGCGASSKKSDKVSISIDTSSTPAATNTNTGATDTDTSDTTSSDTDTSTTGTDTETTGSNTTTTGTKSSTSTTSTRTTTHTTTSIGPSSANGVVCPKGTVVKGLACYTPNGGDPGVNPLKCPTGYTPADGGCLKGGAYTYTTTNKSTTTKSTTTTTN